MWIDGGREECVLVFTEAERRRPINFRELRGCLRVLELWGARLAGCTVVVELDNSASVGASQGMFSKAEDMQELIRRMFERCETFSITLRVIHTPGVSLGRPDAVSRGHLVARPRQRVTAATFSALEARFGPFAEIMGPEAGHPGSDARAGARALWLHPTFDTVASALRLVMERLTLDPATCARGVVVVPWAPEAAWWGLVRHFAVVGHMTPCTCYLEHNRLGSWQPVESRRGALLLRFPRAAGAVAAPLSAMIALGREDRGEFGAAWSVSAAAPLPTGSILYSALRIGDVARRDLEARHGREEAGTLYLTLEAFDGSGAVSCAWLRRSDARGADPGVFVLDRRSYDWQGSGKTAGFLVEPCALWLVGHCATLVSTAHWRFDFRRAERETRSVTDAMSWARLSSQMGGERDAAASADALVALGAALAGLSIDASAEDVSADSAPPPMSGLHRRAEGPVLQAARSAARGEIAAATAAPASITGRVLQQQRATGVLCWGCRAVLGTHGRDSWVCNGGRGLVHDRLECVAMAEQRDFVLDELASADGEGGPVEPGASCEPRGPVDDQTGTSSGGEADPLVVRAAAPDPSEWLPHGQRPTHVPLAQRRPRRDGGAVGSAFVAGPAPPVRELLAASRVQPGVLPSELALHGSCEPCDPIEARGGAPGRDHVHGRGGGRGRGHDGGGDTAPVVGDDAAAIAVSRTISTREARMRSDYHPDRLAKVGRCLRGECACGDEHDMRCTECDVGFHGAVCGELVRGFTLVGVFRCARCRAVEMSGGDPRGFFEGAIPPALFDSGLHTMMLDLTTNAEATGGGFADFYARMEEWRVSRGGGDVRSPLDSEESFKAFLAWIVLERDRALSLHSMWRNAASLLSRIRPADEIWTNRGAVRKLYKKLAKIHGRVPEPDTATTPRMMAVLSDVIDEQFVPALARRNTVLFDLECHGLRVGEATGDTHGVLAPACRILTRHSDGCVFVEITIEDSKTGFSRIVTVIGETLGRGRVRLAQHLRELWAEYDYHIVKRDEGDYRVEYPDYYVLRVGLMGLTEPRLETLLAVLDESACADARKHAKQSRIHAARRTRAGAPAAQRYLDVTGGRQGSAGMARVALELTRAGFGGDRMTVLGGPLIRSTSGGLAAHPLHFPLDPASTYGKITGCIGLAYTRVCEERVRPATIPTSIAVTTRPARL